MVLAIEELYQKVVSKYSTRMSPGVLFGYQAGNFIAGYGPDGYLWDTPHGNWTGSPSVEVGHSNAFPDLIELAITNAESFIDITTMKAPTGRFRSAIVNGLKTLAKNKKTVTVRLLIGIPAIYDNRPNWWDWLNDIKKDMGNLSGYITLDLGVYQYWTVQVYPESWNHSKIIAIDGKILFTGGHNLWAEDYLGTSPIFDLTLRYDGPIAKAGHDYADRLWDFIRQHNRTIHTYSHRLRPDMRIENDPPAFSPMFNAPPRGTTKAMWVGEPGWGIFKDSSGKDFKDSPMRYAFIEALATASHCRISQQSLGSMKCDLPGPPPQFSIRRSDYLVDPMIFHHTPESGGHYYNLPLIDALAEFLRRNSGSRVLEILMSPPDGGRYTNGEAGGAIFDLLAYRMRAHDPFRNFTKQQFVERFKSQIRLVWPAITGPGGPVRFWGVNNAAMATHAKFWMLDSRLYYVGSENFYPIVATSGSLYVEGGLQEFGVIAEVENNFQDVIVGQYHGLAMQYGFPREPELGDFTF